MSPKDAHQAMNLPDNLFVQALIPLGYPDEDPKPRPRKDFDEIVFWEEYRE
jgi:nitroreductase